ncbi:antibiotic biosynthesis monooxygenase [Mycobacterium sp. PS03-16]|uniref:putative quinol monooxygenase n=1 Tax=Mycobacterium sp. PS03-16 TaxID=2559611 RepID=UPI0010734632|nr:antibiotic biosynthesis monooxygenase family protein [Mycobacterium sp. PS03-16]TFV56109.1 antibiotic biosynthesis monooxygenase [Mycobacterium sp. PS03-16]
MVIVAGHLTVDPGQRGAYLAGCVDVVAQARRTAGCLDFAISADLLEAGRVNVYERWESPAALAAFRGSGPDAEQSAAMLTVSVEDYDVA